MLVVGPWESFIGLEDNYKENFFVYNFSSLKENIGPRLQLLPVTQLSVYDKEFDQMYMRFIIDNDLFFMSFMDLMYKLYTGSNVFIAISNGDIYEALAEALTKIIQWRYGYTAQFIHESYDFDPYDNSEFTSIGIQTFDIDLERYIELLESHGINTEGMV